MMQLTYDMEVRFHDLLDIDIDILAWILDRSVVRATDVDVTLREPLYRTRNTSLNKC